MLTLVAAGFESGKQPSFIARCEQELALCHE
jgi:hypothetical protein